MLPDNGIWPDMMGLVLKPLGIIIDYKNSDMVYSDHDILRTI